MRRTLFAAVVCLSIAFGSPSAALQQALPAAGPGSLVAPADITAQAGDTTAMLTWRAVAGADGYRIFQTRPDGSEPELVASVTETEFLARGLDNGGRYRFHVAGYSRDAQGPFSSADVVPVAAAPAPMTEPALPTAVSGSAMAQGGMVAGVPRVSPAAKPVAAATATAPAVVEVPAPVLPPPVATPVTATPEVVAPVSVVAEEVATVDAPPALAVPATPALVARAGNASVTLTWTAASGATSYRIFRSTTTAFGNTPIATVTTTTPFTNTGLTNGTTYNYTVVARNTSGDAPATAMASATPVAPPAAPLGVAATAGDRVVSVSWNAASGATSYSVYRGTVTNTQTLLVKGVTSLPFVDSTVENGPSYFYKVTAVNDGGESARSAEVTANPTGAPAGVDASTLAAYRLLKQSTWGPRPTDFAIVTKMGAAGFIDAQLAAAPSSYPDTLLTLGTDVLQNHFVNLALTGEDQLRQRVAWALHKIWVVSGVEVTSTAGLVNYHRVLLNNAFGNYRTVMEQVTLSPAMGRYLNMLNNRSAQLTGAPANENYARELMQLFTLGIPTLRPDGLPYLDDGGAEIPAYSETDVKELARILTGWTFGDGNPATVPTKAGAENYRVPMEPVPAFHDARAKNFLGMAFSEGQSARADLTQALDLIFAHPNLGLFVSRQLIQQLVTSNPSPGYVWSIAQVFDDNGAGVRGDLAAVVRAILLHPLASEDGPDPGKLSEPILFTIAPLRALEASVTNQRFVVDAATNMGQRVLFPPSVFSYFSPGFRVRGALAGNGRPLAGPEFQALTTVTAQTRVNYIASILAGSYDGSMIIDYTAFTSRAADPAVLVDYCSEVLMGTRMPLAMRNEIITAVRATAASVPLERVRTALYLTLTAAQYQVD